VLYILFDSILNICLGNFNGQSMSGKGSKTFSNGDIYEGIFIFSLSVFQDNQVFQK
jgi:hypothetical protein